MKKGVKLPKSPQHWALANDFFKAAFSNKPIGSSNVSDVINEFNCVIYNYFKDICGPVENNHNKRLSAKYKDNTTKDLKGILKALKRSGGDIEEIKFVSRELRHKLRNGNNGDINTKVNTNLDHDSLIGKSFWGYIKRFLTSKTKQLPSFTEARCISFFRNTFASLNPNKHFPIPSWIPLFAPPQIPFTSEPPSYQKVTNIIRNMKSSGSPCPLDQLSIIAFKRCPYLRTYLTDIIRSVWYSGEIPTEWKKACTILIHKKCGTDDPANFRPITLESVPLKVFTSCLRNSLYQFLLKNNYIECKIQKGFTSKVSGTLKHTSQMAHVINMARIKQRSLIITLLDLINAFGEVHHNLIFEVLKYHHIPSHIRNLIRNLYTDFHTSIITSEFNSPFPHVGRGVLQGDCLSPLLFNLCLNTFIQHIKAEKYNQFGFSTSYGPRSSFVPLHWFQFADDAAVLSGQEQESQLLLNRFCIWCKWAGMQIRVDKCVTFGIKKCSTKSSQFQPKLLIDGNLIPTVKTGESFRYLGRHFDFNMSNNTHKSELSQLTNSILTDIDLLPLHPKNKIALYNRFLLSKLSWHFTVADLPRTWVCEHLDSVVAKFIRKWLDLPISATLSNITLPQTKFGLNILFPSTKFAQCQTVLRNVLKNSQNEDIKALWKFTSSHTNIQYDMYRNTKEVIKAIHDEHEDRLKTHLISQGSFFSNIIDNSLSKVNSVWSLAQRNLPKNIFNFTIRYINNSLSTPKNLVKWGMSPTSDCSFCLLPETLLHVVSGCNTYLVQGRYTWRHDSILNFLASSFQSVRDSIIYADLPGFLNPCVITGDSLRPDLLLVLPNKCLYILELTVGFESNIRKNSHRKHTKYHDLIKQQEHLFTEVKYVNLSVSTLGVFDQLSLSFLDMLKDLNYDSSTRNYITRKITTIAIRTTYYIFCRRNKDWDNPGLLFY